MAVNVSLLLVSGIDKAENLITLQETTKSYSTWKKLSVMIQNSWPVKENTCRLLRGVWPAGPDPGFFL